MSEKGELDLSGAKHNTGMWLVKVSGAREPLGAILGLEAAPQPLGGRQRALGALLRGSIESRWAGRESVGGQTLTVFTESSAERLKEESYFSICETSESSLPGRSLRPAAVFLAISSAQLKANQMKNLKAAVLLQKLLQRSRLVLSYCSDKLSLEGIVVQRAECRPAASENYMKLKRLQIEESSKPVRLSQQLDKAVTTNYKPVANHQYNIEYEKKKKEDGKRARADKQQVLDMLFSAFEKHQYYNIKDLVDITKQPVIYLKEILREIGIYNVKGTHKNTWELKPEYRHYQVEDKSD
ncbi:General transcription factor IIF subunit 2 [Aix galericulata]|nr:General transcription factor IIF subunit 2 [Aix galericulata]